MIYIFLRFVFVLNIIFTSLSTTTWKTCGFMKHDLRPLLSVTASHILFFVDRFTDNDLELWSLSLLAIELIKRKYVDFLFFLFVI
jgi:hypothetical protein